MTQTKSPNGKPLINVIAVENRRISAADANAAKAASATWRCHHCGRTLSSELMYERHSCKERERALQMATPTGQAAYSFYREWMRLRKFSEQTVATFTQSRFYIAFIRFAEFVAKTGIQHPLKYIKIMVDADNSPSLWHRQECYAQYLTRLEKSVSVDEQIESSIVHLEKLVGEGNLNKVASTLSVPEFIGMVKRQELSPWVIFNSPALRGLIRTQMSQEERVRFSEMVNGTMWVKRKMETHKAFCEELEKVLVSLGL